MKTNVALIQLSYILYSTANDKNSLGR